MNQQHHTAGPHGTGHSTGHGTGVRAPGESGAAPPDRARPRDGDGDGDETLRLALASVCRPTMTAAGRAALNVAATDQRLLCAAVEAKIPGMLACHLTGDVPAPAAGTVPTGPSPLPDLFDAGAVIEDGVIADPLAPGAAAICSPPRQLVRFLRGVLRSARHVAAVQRAEAVVLCAALEEAGIPAAVVHGLALASTRYRAGARALGDVDVLIGPADLGPATQVAATCGLRPHLDHPSILAAAAADDDDDDDDANAANSDRELAADDGAPVTTPDTAAGLTVEGAGDDESRRARWARRAAPLPPAWFAVTADVLVPRVTLDLAGAPYLRDGEIRALLARRTVAETAEGNLPVLTDADAMVATLARLAHRDRARPRHPGPARRPRSWHLEADVWHLAPHVRADAPAPPGALAARAQQGRSLLAARWSPPIPPLPGAQGAP